MGAAPASLMAATFPSYLPHRPVTLGITIALCWVIGRALAVGVARHVSRRARGSSWQRVRRHQGPIRTTALTVCAVATIAVFNDALQTQNTLRSELGMEQISTRDLAVSGSVAALILGGLRLARQALRHLDGRRTAVVAITAGAIVTVIYPMQLTTAPPTAASQILLQRSDAGAVRAYVSLSEASDHRGRATLAAERLMRSGGLRRERIVIVVPTGSGWVNPRLVRGLEQRFGSEVATVAAQYDDRPSWLSFLLGRDDARASARALLDAVATRVEELPLHERPQLHVIGESLGATAGQEIFRGAGGAAARERVCSVLWVGTPGGGEVGMAREAVVANPTDPIVHTSPSMLIKPPGDDRPWLPVISFAQAGVDYLSALAVPDGAGHRYGEQQAYALPECA